MEIVDIYDGKKNKTGKTVERSEKPILGEYRLSIHIWITNSKGEILCGHMKAYFTRFTLWASAARRLNTTASKQAGF